MNEQRWTTEITSRKGWYDLNLRDLWQYRELVLLLVRRDFVTVYKQTVLGPLWFVLQPLASTLVFTLVFGYIVGISTEEVPKSLFYLSGIVVWNFFSACVLRTSDILVANAGLFGKVYFPRLAIPVAVVLVNLITFVLQLLLFLLVLTYFQWNGASVQPNLMVIILPLLIIQTAALSFGTGILISSLTTKYRDLSFLTAFAVQLWMYVTPVVYPMSIVPQEWIWCFRLNPMTSVIDSFRYAFLGVGSIDSFGMAISLLETAVILILAVGVFTRVEKTFMDTV